MSPFNLRYKIRTFLHTSEILTKAGFCLILFIAVSVISPISVDICKLFLIFCDLRATFGSAIKKATSSCCWVNSSFHLKPLKLLPSHKPKAWGNMFSLETVLAYSGQLSYFNKTVKTRTRRRNRFTMRGLYFVY